MKLKFKYWRGSLLEMFGDVNKLCDKLRKWSCAREGDERTEISVSWLKERSITCKWGYLESKETFVRFWCERFKVVNPKEPSTIKNKYIKKKKTVNK